MAPQGKTPRLNRRSFKRYKLDTDGQWIYHVVSFKFKDRKFARPVIISDKMAADWYMESFRKNGWTEEDFNQ